MIAAAVMKVVTASHSFLLPLLYLSATLHLSSPSFPTNQVKGGKPRPKNVLKFEDESKILKKNKKDAKNC